MSPQNHQHRQQVVVENSSNPPTAEELAKARQDIAALDREIASAQRERDQVEGAFNQVKQQILDEFGLETLEQINTELDSYVEKINTLSRQLVDKTTRLKEEFEW